MKIWRTWTSDPHEGTVYQWSSTKAEAIRARRIMKEEGYDTDIAIEQVDIPTDKRGLVNWLNDNFTLDNG